jgi:2-polyprenyl-6-methoxyphenol hydroxylase-like FAD-dependent oxidoreductase
MKICIYGAGSIGGYLGVELAQAGHDVSLVARGAHLQAIREKGLKLLIDDKEKVARIPASEDPREFGAQALGGETAGDDRSGRKDLEHARTGARHWLRCLSFV